MGLKEILITGGIIVIIAAVVLKVHLLFCIAIKRDPVRLEKIIFYVLCVIGIFFFIFIRKI